jgi:L-iditol 2-dehydrogenase
MADAAMRAARLYGASDVRVDEVAVPTAGPGEALVRVRAVSICPSDWRLYVDGHAGGKEPEWPFVQGHEFAGDVVALGSDVAGPAPGTRVAVEPSWPCGSCDMCREGKHHICRHVRFASFPPHGGALAQYVVVPHDALFPLPDALDYVAGALSEPLCVALHATRLAQLRPGESVVLLGAGVIGVSTLQMALAEGVGPTAVIEPVAERCALPQELGAAQVFASLNEATAAGVEADVVFECSGDIPALDQCIRLARPGGRIVVIGIPRCEEITFDIATARRHELTITFSRRSFGMVEEGLALLASGALRLRDLPLQRFALDQTTEAMEMTGRPGRNLRAVVEP